LRAIINAKVMQSDGSFASGSVLVDGGRIVACGDVVVPAQAVITDAGGAYLIPGLIDIHTQLGLREEGFGAEGTDHNEATAPATPQLRALDAINPEDLAFADARLAGVTTLGCAPGAANVIGGQGVVIKTSGRVVDHMVIGPWGLKAALGEEPKSGRQGKMPSTRMGAAGVLRAELVKARSYLEKRGSDRPPDPDLGLEALLPVLQREAPLWVQANRADDILTAVRIAREFGLKLVILQAAEAHRVAEELLEVGAGCVLGPLSGFRFRVELRGLDPSGPARLAAAGVPVALSTCHPATSIGSLPVQAALAIRFGLDEATALRAVTAVPAQLGGVGDRVGAIAPGLDADLVLLNGPPFYLRSSPRWVMVGGEFVS
jgi:imidazolonepropionase-like amidohydrolase